MQPLNALLVAKQYKEIFEVEDKEAEKMASLVQGYPYAYQVLGYLCYKLKQPYNKVLDEFDAYLSEYVYEKIWYELSDQDKTVMEGIAKSERGRVEEIRMLLKMESAKFSVYRDRLIKKGLIRSASRGFLELTLPRFDTFVKRATE